jgi:hypothetical protein
MAPLLAALALAAGPSLHGYGMSMRLPPGWHGRISAGVLAAATFPIPRADTGFGPGTARRMRRGDVLLLLSEYEGMPGEQLLCLPRRQAPPLAGPGSFCLSGRHFVRFVKRHAPSRATLAQADRALASFTVRGGDFYPGTVAPARFPARRDWHVGTGGRSAVRAEGEQTTSWAATVPWRDGPNQLPPHRTLARLPRDGIAIFVALFRDNRRPRQRPWNSLRIDGRRTSGGFEGLPSRFGLYRADVPRGRYVVDLWVFFGTLHPSAATVERAQAELDAVRLPIWPRV